MHPMHEDLKQSAPVWKPAWFPKGSRHKSVTFVPRGEPSVFQPDYTWTIKDKPVLEKIRAGGCGVANDERCSLPVKGRDVIVQSQSGTGKTCVFALGALSAVSTRDRDPQVLTTPRTPNLS